MQSLARRAKARALRARVQIACSVRPIGPGLQGIRRVRVGLAKSTRCVTAASISSGNNK